MPTTKDIKHDRLKELYKDISSKHRRLQREYQAIAFENRDLRATLDAAKLLLNIEAK